VTPLIIGCDDDIDLSTIVRALRREGLALDVCDEGAVRFRMHKVHSFNKSDRYYADLEPRKET
jgi:hypothetical protein